MCRVNVGLLMFILLSSSAFSAENGSFPYQARVVVEELFVRSGSGESWHPTQKLTEGTMVTVRRHDPGGWYQIAPPEGSFSWVPVRFVKRLSEREGEISENNVVAFVGSDFGDDLSVWQRSLPAGEKVTIIGEQEIESLSGRQKMFKILPPKLEWRWIPGSGVVPVDEARRRQNDNDPFATPSNANRPRTETVHKAGSGDGVSDVPPISPDSQLAHLQRIRNDQKSLAEIDRRFRDMILQDPMAWQLDGIEQEYRSLQHRTTYKPVAGQIDLRFPAIEKYRRRQAELHDFKQLTSQTEMRDAELRSRMTGNAAFSGSMLASSQPVATEIPNAASWPQDASAPFPVPSASEVSSNGSVTSVASDATVFGSDGVQGTQISMSSDAGGFDAASSPPTELQIPMEGLSVPVSDIAANPVDSFHVPTENSGVNASPMPEASAANPFAVPGNSEADGMPRLVGAGIVQRSSGRASETPYVLINSAGRVLADLRPAEGVSLEEFVGQAVGVHGNRWFSEAAKHDTIEVTGLAPVRLRQ
ncbi:MAG: SH3 domain-containing protein [Planctomyces sp.]